MDKLLILEYNASKGSFHENMVQDNHPQTQPNTNGWDAIAYTTEDKARIFCNMMNCKIHKREFFNNAPYTTEYIRKEWKLFCYVFNEIVNSIEISPELKKTTAALFNNSKALARLGNGHFSDMRVDEDLPWAWEYNPLDFKDSNF